MENYVVSLIIFTATFALFSLGLNLQWGCTGLINFGHIAFMTMGAYTTVLLDLQGVPLPLATIAGMVAAAVVGALMGLLTLRLREDYLAIVTIGAAEIIRLITINEAQITRGTFGLQRYTIPLAQLQPSLVVRLGMILLFTAIAAIGYWQLGRWVWRRSRSVSPQALWAGIGGVVGLSLIVVLLSGSVAAIARSLPVEPLPVAWLSRSGCLIAWIGIGLGATQCSTRLSQRLPAWPVAVSISSVSAVMIIGIWLYGLAVSALYHYDRNPMKTGLMLLSVTILAGVFWQLERLQRSPWGRLLNAIREDDMIVTALGKPVFWYKLQALMLGAMIAGLAGALYAWQLTVVYPDNFPPLMTFNAWIIVVLGGAGNHVGTLLGAAIFWGYDTLTRFYLPDYIPLDDARLGALRVMVIGLILMGLMVWRPQGILGKQDELTLNR